MNILISVLALSGLGALIGLLLAIADKWLYVEEDPRIDLVEGVLPAGQCGACGYAGCRQYAEKVVLEPRVSTTLCTPGGADVAREVARISGKEAEEMVPAKAVVACGGGNVEGCHSLFTYQGIADCRAASLLTEGEKACKWGCLGLGSCVSVCPENAIRINGRGVAEVDKDACIGCGICVRACPKDVIVMVPETAKTMVFCRNPEKGGETKKACDFGCIGCRLCTKACPHGAVAMAGNLPEIDYARCAVCPEPVCLEVKCKPGCFLPVSGIRPVERPEAQAA
ncbi:RnfABCDGE-type electron transport complex B subunit [Desulfobotulus alkaliphilus]|uniref:Ion-translocating oxidoreductase complex subunit B n=1 Tax=Desulfobotulus alkaliphilus TaxID=622671 RepID=A0A562R6C7_9BACT|nr:RnfABCDGE type electron transport complex subunit B [Desulfobotulus alkaliphilus]TWI64618.1 RnfABCDGE-type electron transport complex B subunit [Desulfobotulus alkaliphilus]